MRQVIIFAITSLFLFSCKASDSLPKEESATQTREKIENQTYTFNVDKALPMSGRSIDVGRSYYLKVSKDTILAYLPYFGRTYSAPLANDEGGIRFTSTDFDYSTSIKGTWKIKIKINDNQKRYQLFLDIGNNGKASLNVQDIRRQAMNYYGQIE